jgi:hypothetical protein
VSGQLQGGIAMGIGHALHEFLPLYEDGPGNGTELQRYHLPRASDVAVWKQTGTVLPPISDTDPPKGIAEVVMIPVVGAIVNGIAHAIGHRFTDLPVTAEKIRRYWHDRHASIVHEHQRQGRRSVEVPVGLMMIDFLHEYVNLTGSRWGAAGRLPRLRGDSRPPGRHERNHRTCITARILPGQARPHRKAMASATTRAKSSR